MNAYFASFMLLIFSAVGVQAAETASSSEATSHGSVISNDPNKPLQEIDFRAALAEWRKQVFANAWKFYSARSVEAGEEGRSVVRIRLTENANIDQCSIVESNGYSTLDRQSCFLALSVRPTPVPADESGRAISQMMTLPVRWKLVDYDYVEGAP